MGCTDQGGGPHLYPRERVREAAARKLIFDMGLAWGDGTCHEYDLRYVEAALDAYADARVAEAVRGKPLSHGERDRLARLEKRAEWLAQRIAAQSERDLTDDKAELSALRWAIDEIRAARRATAAGGGEDA